MSKRGVWALALHGGAGPLSKKSYTDEEAHMADLLREGGKRLESGEAAMDVAVAMVEALEDSGYHIAGKGASPNRNGQYELDAAVMNGSNRKAGAVAALCGYRSPVRVAEAVMNETPHVMLVGEGAASFAKAQKMKRVKHPEKYYKPSVKVPMSDGELQHGTVGAVVLDNEGRLAAATSTGGLLNKTPGRVGDSPILGAGTWADERVAVSCTGQGEFFMRTATAADVSARLRYGRMKLTNATKGALDDMAYLGGEGGMIAIDCLGRVSMAFNTEGMKRGSLSAGGEPVVATRV